MTQELLGNDASPARQSGFHRALPAHASLSQPNLNKKVLRWFGFAQCGKLRGLFSHKKEISDESMGDVVMSIRKRDGQDCDITTPPSLSMEPEDFFRWMAEHFGELARLTARQAKHAEQPSELATTDPDIRHINGLDDITAAIDKALAGARREILTAQPDGPRPKPVLKDALESVRPYITANVAMRTLYQHTTRFDEATKEYVRLVTEYGVKVRTLEEFFDRLIIIDDSVAFIPANEARTSAVAITNSAVIRFLRDTFERAWDRARPFPFVPVHAAKAADEVIPAIRESISRLLVEGYSDKHIARRIGISERSLQAHISAIKQELGAHNRLQLGYLLARNETTYLL